MRNPQSCSHTHLTLTPSPLAAVSGYKRPTPSALAAAAQPTGRVPSTAAQPGVAGGKRHSQPTSIDPSSLLPSPATFPAPLVLPGDDLAHDPKQPPQSLRAWMRLKDRNAVMKERNVVYVAAPPTPAGFMEGWERPIGSSAKETSSTDWGAVTEYLRSFYHGITIRPFTAPLSFCAWDTEPSPGRKKPRSKTSQLHKQPNTPTYIGLQCPSIAQTIGIRTRADPTSTFPAQLNLNDLLDAAIELLPDDAYTLLLLVPWDLYEDENDDYCCGRAYGGSRIAVVSAARYQTVLDEREGVDEDHSWPTSHCAAFVSSLLPVSAGRKATSKAKTSVTGVPLDPSTPLGATVTAASSTAKGTDADTLLFRVCRTASHELGHCFGLEHCVYYACVMQSTASMAEDVRQPPYLCAVCVGKVGRAVREGVLARGDGEAVSDAGDTGKKAKEEADGVWLREWEAEWCKALAGFCEGRSGTGWVGLRAWVEGRRRELDR